MLWRILQWFARLFLGALFLYAGYAKLREPFLFEMAVDSYQLLPPWGVIAVARTLPWLEAALGLALLVGWQLPYFASFTCLLLGFFLSLMAISYARGVEATCGCFGLGEPVGPYTLARDAALFGVSLYLAVRAWLSRVPRTGGAGSASAASAAVETTG
ncbi:MAG TPA: MauE/DoxX family redox-associated membrane protein [Terriglobia bacterium]|nr:MauE/DoxX family redox-associated membrane protein [Terriglobia bacterium]